MPSIIEHGQRVDIDIDAGVDLGLMEMWRHSVGIGGVHSLPLPDAVVEGTRRLRPPLIRIFIQQFFDIYPDHGRFEWECLDAYMDAIDRTGAQIVAAICIKPAPLFPTIDHAQWRPSDIDEWQHVIRELVRRYSVERHLVTYWEIGNETDIGEDGGCPYLIPDPNDYAEYYTFTAAAVRDAAPDVKVGGTAAVGATSEPLPGFVAHCAATGTPLDFISWHVYNDDWSRHAEGVREGRQLLTQIPGPTPEMMVTEWNKSFDPISIPDQALDARRAALVAASILAMRQEQLDWSFYYHLWDQYLDTRGFEKFFSPAGVSNMYEHWNERPHRFGLFSESGQVRPQYFIYQMLTLLGTTKISSRTSGAGDNLHAISARDEATVSSLLVNVSLDPSASEPCLATLKIGGLAPGERLLTVYRIDDERRWDAGTLEMEPLETRRVFVRDQFECQLYLPADSVTLFTLSELAQAS